ncbi:MAG: tetratricopeptide repeat protein [Lysobacterales bacterium]
MSNKLLAGIALWCLLMTTAVTATAKESDTKPASGRGEVGSPFGIPGQQATDDVWKQFLAGSDLTRAGNALRFLNELFDETGELDPALCKSREQEIREALAEIPVSAGMWFYGGRCAELNGDSELAAQSEAVLAALLDYSLSQRRLASYSRPIPVLGENDISAILELTGETVLTMFYQVPANGRYMRMIVSLKDEDSGRQSSLYFDFLDSYVQLGHDIPDLQFPAGRQQFAREILKSMDGSTPAEIARDTWDALSLKTPEQRSQAIRDLGKKEGDYQLWTGILCLTIEVFDCASDGIELILPYAEAESADAYVALAVAYAEGHGVERDEGAARDMMAEANRVLGEPNAEIALQALLESMRGHTRLHPLVAQTLRDAAKTGDPLASLLVALDTGDWTRDSVPEAALPLLKTAANGGVAIALGLIGRHHLDAGETEQGLAMLRQAAEAGDDQAAEALGLAYALGDVVERNVDQSRRWLLAAAQGGRESAMKMLAIDYQNGETAEDFLLAERWYANAVARGDLQAVQQMARFLNWSPRVKDPVMRSKPLRRTDRKARLEFSADQTGEVALA